MDQVYDSHEGTPFAWEVDIDIWLVPTLVDDCHIGEGFTWVMYSWPLHSKFYIQWVTLYCSLPTGDCSTVSFNDHLVWLHPKVYHVYTPPLVVLEVLYLCKLASVNHSNRWANSRGGFPHINRYPVAFQARSSIYSAIPLLYMVIYIIEMHKEAEVSAFQSKHS